MQLFRSIYSFWKDKDYRDLIYATSALLAVGTVVYHLIEGWTWLDSFYFCFITLTTIGFGDFAPQTPWGKVFTMFYITMGIGMILSFIDTVYKHFSKGGRIINVDDKEK
jgi:hypothetical protein